MRGRLLPAQSRDAALGSLERRVSEPRPRGIYVSRIGRRAKRKSVLRDGYVEWFSPGCPRARRDAAWRNRADRAENCRRQAWLPLRGGAIEIWAAVIHYHRQSTCRQ